MEKTLGSVPLSSNVLDNFNIGLWAFELDEGQAPRMYVDDVMLGLIGLQHQVSPEETYHAWYDHIDEGSCNLVEKSVQKMMAGKHAEVQYPWHHPDGHTIIVRCGGVRNPLYTKGIRVEGVHRDVTSLLHYDITEQQRADAVLNNFLKESKLVFVANLRKDTYTIYQSEKENETRTEEGEHFSTFMKEYLKENAYENDFERMAETLSNEAILERLKENDSFEENFRLQEQDGNVRWHKAVVKKLHAKEVAISICNNDRQYLGRMCSDILLKDYGSIYVANLKKDIARAVVPSKRLGIENVPQLPYSELAQRIANVAGSQYHIEWLCMSKPEGLQQYLEKADHREYHFSLSDNESIWWRTTFDVVERVDGIAQVVVISSGVIDQLHAEKMNLNQRLYEQHKLVVRLAADFVRASAIHLKENKEEDVAELIFDNHSQFEQIPGFSNALPFSQQIHLYAEHIVHPEDKETFLQMIDRDTILASIIEEPFYNVNYRTLVNNEVHYFQMRFASIEDYSLELGFVMGLRNVDAEKEAEETAKVAKQTQSIVEGFMQKYSSVFLLKAEDYTFSLLKISPDMEAYFGHGGSIIEARSEYFNSCIYEPDREKTLQAILPDSVKAGLTKSANYTVEFRAYVDEVPLWHQITFSHTGKQGEILVGMEEKDKEILMQKIDKNRRNKTSGIFVANLKTNQLKILKPAGILKDCKGFSVPYDKSCLQMASQLSGDAKAFYENMSNPQKAKQMLEQDAMLSIIYKNSSEESSRWVRCACTVLGCVDGKPSTFAVYYTEVDSLQKQKLELDEKLKQMQEKEKEYNTIIEALASDYQNIYKLDYTNDLVFVHKESERIAKMFGESFAHMSIDEASRAYIEQAVAPEEREEMHLYLSKEGLMRELYGVKNFVKYYRNNEGKYTEMKAVRTDDDNILVIGFGVKDAEIRREKERTAAIEKAELERQRLIEESKREREAEKERYNFLVNVAHELRTPLTLIMGPLKRVARTETISDKGQHSIVNILRQADKMGVLLNTILTSNKIEEGAAGATPTPVELNKWVSNTADEFRDEAEEHHMGIEVILDPTIGAVPMDEHLCKIALSNFMINALRHNRMECNIQLTTRWNEQRTAVRVSVKDQGTGIGNVDVSKLFLRYYRATEEKTGFGIGLAYSRTIIEAHGGTIGAYNNPDNPGATFWFELPADHQSYIPPKPTIQIDNTTFYDQCEVETKGLKGKTILYADDDMDLREYLKEELEPVCRKVITAYNGRNALEILAKEKVDILITDVMMPEIDGIELCRNLKHDLRHHHIPVIMLTARADKASHDEGKAAQANYYIDKPFDIDKLLEILEELAEKG